MSVLHKPHAIPILLWRVRTCGLSALLLFLVGGVRPEVLLGSCSCGAGAASCPAAGAAALLGLGPQSCRCLGRGCRQAPFKALRV